MKKDIVDTDYRKLVEENISLKNKLEDARDELDKKLLLIGNLAIKLAIFTAEAERLKGPDHEKNVNNIFLSREM